MELDDILALVNSKLGTLLEARFTGNIVFTIHCREGGVGRVSLQVNQDFSKKDLPNSQK
jgi:hypothetical protein